MGSGRRFHGSLPTRGGVGREQRGLPPKNDGAKSESIKTPKISERGQELLHQAKTQETKNLIRELYRPGATIGDGGTADALRHEEKTGQNVGNKSHRLKAVERARQIERTLKRDPNHPDKELLKTLYNDLDDAINRKDKK